jgi:hypothetical protein
MQYKISLTAMAVISLLGVSANSFAFIEASASARESEKAVFDQRYTLIDNGVSIIDAVRSAVLGSYVKNSGWPTNTASLVGGGYLSTISASWGQNVLGTATGGGNSYTLALNAPSAEIAQAIAAKIAGVAAGSSVQVTIPIPAMASVNQNNLSRVAVAGEPDLNKMFTNIDMNSFSLGNVNQVDAVIINGTTSTIGELTVNTSLDVVPDATFRRNVTIAGNATVNEFTANAITINGGVEVGTFIRASGDVSGKNLIATQDIVAGSQIRANSGVFVGGVSADSAILKSGTIDSLVAKNTTVQNMFISQGNSEFYQDALFKGSVTVNGALSVGGIASALDIREGGVFLKDKYSQLAGINVFTENNSFNKMVALNGGASVDGKTVVSADGKTLYEDGVSLDTKYLGINAKAVSAINADKLGDVAASSFARKDSDNTFTKGNTFTQSVALNGGVTVDGKQVISADGSTLYENGQALSTRYLGINATAKNSEKLGDVAASSFARRDVDNTYNGKNTFNSAVYTNGGLITAGKWVVSADGSTLYEGGVALSSKYLGINSKATSATNADNALNADKLGNVAASSYARKDSDNTFTKGNTFTQSVALNGGVTVDGKQVISADGSTLYENGQALSTRYLGINATAKNSEKLGNVAASSFARKDIAETFNEGVNFNKGIHVRSDWVRVDGNSGIYFQSYGGGWHMDDSTFIKAYGGKSIYTSGMVRADSGIQVDGKWVVSSDGNSLYENNVALSSKYLGKSDTSLNSAKLGGIDAVNFARKDIANTFSQRQTFNGGISAGGSSTLGTVTLTGNLSFTDNAGVSKNLRTMSGDVDALKKWKAACQRGLADPDCGLDAGNSSKMGTTLYSSPSGLTGGNFVLSQPYSNFDYITVYGTNDNNEQGAVTTWTAEQIDFLQSTSTSAKALTLWFTDNEYWTGRFATNKRSFTTYDENAKIRKVVGYKS